MSRVLAVARNTFRETVRERVLYNLVFFAILMTLAGLLLGQLSIRQDERIIKDLALAAMDVFGTAIAIFVGVSLVSKEIERRSLYPLLAKPLSRDEFLVGKFLGLAFTLLTNLSAMCLGMYAVLLATGRGADPALLKAVYGIYLALLVTVAMALALSVVTSATIAAVGSLCLVVAGRFADVLQHASELAPGAPQWLLRVVFYVIPHFRHFDFKGPVVHGDPVKLADLAWVTAYAAAYTGVLLGIAVTVFRRRDLM